MYKTQNITFEEIRSEISNGLKEILLKQLDNDIKECITLMKKQPENAEELNKKYINFIGERNRLLAED